VKSFSRCSKALFAGLAASLLFLPLTAGCGGNADYTAGAEYSVPLGERRAERHVPPPVESAPPARLASRTADSAEAERGAEDDSMVTMAYSVQRLLIARQDFKPPQMRIDRSKMFSDSTGNDQGTELAGGGDEESGGRNDFRPPDELVQFIKSVVAPGTWGEDGEEGKGSISVSKGILFVRHTVKVQREIARLLAELGN
jgi:hypothetical protein